MPRPKKLRDDSSSRMPPMAPLIPTTSGAIALGTRCFLMMSQVGMPRAISARMKSCSLSDSIWPRMSRAVPDQFTIARAPNRMM